MNENDRVRYRHMLDAAREAISFIKGRTRDDLFRDRMLLLALVKEIEIIGEAAGKISLEARSEARGIPWAAITAMRNRLTHAYFDWNREVIWSTLTSNLPELIVQLEELLSAAE
jgi:uncharacterized protein with HEPN domain